MSDLNAQQRDVLAGAMFQQMLALRHRDPYDRLYMCPQQDVPCGARECAIHGCACTWETANDPR
jgi:hypothetical protein